jgi:translation elongation factor EF-Tu-like GTPase
MEARHRALIEQRDDVMRNQAIHNARQAQRDSRPEPPAAAETATAAGAFRFVVGDAIFPMGTTRRLGDVKDGVCRLADQVQINGEGAAVVNAINAFLKDLPETTPGLSCALELGGVDSGQIFKGGVISR